MPTLLSVNVGKPKDVPWQGKTVYTGIWKESVTGPRMVRRLNIDGDGQGDLAGHGGEQRAVLVYQIESYEHWQRHFGRDDFTYGQFGENLTVSGLPDDEVCIGDRYRIGEAEFEVTQPRVTCFRVGMRLGAPEMPSLLVSHHRPGFYMRVISEGQVQAGDEIVKTLSGPERVSVADIDALLYLPNRDTALLHRALRIPALSPGWQGSFRELLDDSAAAPAIGVEPGWTGFRPLRVVETVPESDTVCSIRLTTVDGQSLPAALPGQYLTLRVPDAADPPPVRSYSLSSAPGASTYRISVKNEPHGLVSGYLHAKLRAGAILDVAAPRGEFVLTDDDSPVLLLSAGVGVTPVMAMLYRLSAQQSKREVWWLHGARSVAEHALAAEAHELLAGLPNAHEEIYYSAEEVPTAHHGRLTGAALSELDIPADATAYICGPTGFMADLQQALTELGIADVHTELFGALPPINPGIVGAATVQPHQPDGPPGTGPLVTFARSGLSVPWADARRCLLELAEACDVPARWSCRTGVCHTCITPLLSGEVAYSPTPLEMPERGDVLLCCSTPQRDVVLDM